MQYNPLLKHRTGSCSHVLGSTKVLAYHVEAQEINSNFKEHAIFRSRIKTFVSRKFSRITNTISGPKIGPCYRHSCVLQLIFIMPAASKSSQKSLGNGQKPVSDSPDYAFRGKWKCAQNWNLNTNVTASQQYGCSGAYAALFSIHLCSCTRQCKVFHSEKTEAK